MDKTGILRDFFEHYRDFPPVVTVTKTLGRLRRVRKPSITAIIKQARNAGERGPVRIERVNPDGSRTIITSSSEPTADLTAEDNAEKLWQERIARNGSH
jgi:hypothetical protein